MPWGVGTVVFIIDARGPEIINTMVLQRFYGILLMLSQNENSREI